MEEYINEGLSDIVKGLNSEARKLMGEYDVLMPEVMEGMKKRADWL